MKRYMLSLLVCLCAATCFGKDTEVILTRKYTSAERQIIPEKTDQFQVQNIAFSSNEQVKSIVDAVNKLVNIINEEDFEHYVFSLYVYPLDDDTFCLQIESHDPMNDTKPLRENMLGAMKLGYRYFIVQKMPDLESLQKQLLVKAKGKIKFVREFELVTVKSNPTRTAIVADLKNGTLTFKELEICNVNKLENPAQGEEAEKDYHPTLLN